MRTTSKKTKKTKLPVPPSGAIAKRNGGNGGYNQRTSGAEAINTPMVRREYNLRTYSGEKYEPRD